MNTQKIREAILEVIDDGCICNDNSEKHPWELNEWTDEDPDFANMQRLRFCDAVIAKLEAGTSGGNGGQYHVPSLPIEVKP